MSANFKLPPDQPRHQLLRISPGDRDALRIASHTLKSNARDFGAHTLADLCADLEHACREGMPPDPVAAAAADRISREEAATHKALSEIDLLALARPESA